jgi:hypothetical protein
MRTLLVVVAFLIACDGDRSRAIDIQPSVVEVTLYPVLYKSGQRALPLNRSTYRLDMEHQTAISWTPGVSDSPTRWKDCAIRDRANWRCDDESAGSVLMENGAYRVLDRFGNDTLAQLGVRYGTRVEYEAAERLWR